MNREASALHVLLDFFDCDHSLLEDAAALREALYAAASETGLTVLNEMFHRFQPHGVSGVLLISESHVSIHTWPERCFAAVDVFSCKPQISPERFRAAFERALRPGRVEMRVIERGEREAGRTAPAKRTRSGKR